MINFLIKYQICILTGIMSSLGMLITMYIHENQLVDITTTDWYKKQTKKKETKWLNIKILIFLKFLKNYY